MSTVLERLLRYVAYDTQSVEKADCFPSTEKQKVLGRALMEELRELGAANVRMMEPYGYVFADIPSNLPDGRKQPVIGFLAHLDTAPAVSGANVRPRVIRNYDGGDIPLNEQVTMTLQEFPEMASYRGKTLVVTDGTTLLGADDKAGVAEIMTMAEILLTHPEIPHGELRIGFTLDEEVGRSADFFDVAAFGADFAYTVDGGPLGMLDYENFNSANATVRIAGTNMNIGGAKGRMKNALTLAGELDRLLPAEQRPEFTEKYEGYFHCRRLQGDHTGAEAEYLIRDHDREKFARKKQLLLDAAEFLNRKYGPDTVRVEMADAYYNMRDKLEPNWHLIENALSAMEELGITPIMTPIRGCTDGAKLSWMGLPCPNLCTGAYHYHTVYEFCCVESMEQTVELLLHIVRRYAE